jgi:hypothetical protein
MIAKIYGAIEMLLPRHTRDKIRILNGDCVGGGHAR